MEEESSFSEGVKLIFERILASYYVAIGIPWYTDRR